MPSSETIELRKVKGVVGSKEDLPSQSPRVSLASRALALQLRNQGTPELMHLYGVFEQNETLTLDADEYYIGDIVSDGTYLYYSLLTNPGKIVKIDLKTFTKLKTLTLDVSETQIYSLSLDDTYVYAATNNLKMVRIKKDSFTRDSVIALSGSIFTTSSDGTFLYAISGDSPIIVDKIDINTFTLVASLTLNAGENWGLDSCIDGSYLYVGTFVAPGKIVKIDLSTFTRDNALTLDIGENYAYNLCIVGSYLYAGLGVTPGKIVKIDLNNLTKINTLTLTGSDVRTITSDGTYLYVGHASTPGEITKISIATFSEVTVDILDVGDNICNKLLTDGLFVYVGLRTSPGKLSRRYIMPTSNLYEREIELIYEQIKTGTHHVYPTLASAIQLVSSAVAWTIGNYVEIIPVDTIKTQFFITGIVLNNLVIDSEYEVTIATGLAASEIDIITVTHETNDTNLSVNIPISPPIKVSSNTRISASAATENAAADTCTIKLMCKV